MQILKQSTAIDIRLGPFVDVTDAVTPETGITLGAADQAEILKSDGAATVAMAGTFAAVTGSDGWYDYTLSTTDTNTIGTLEIVVQDSSVCLPVMARFQVVEEAVYDIMFASGATFEVTADMVKLSGDATAADNLEATYDGTGYSDDAAPATQSQLGSLAVGSAAISVSAESRTLTTGSEVNAVTDTETLNGIYHEISDAAGVLELFYQFDVTGSGVATEVTMVGRLNGSNDSIDVFAKNWDGGPSWDQIATLQGANTTTDGTLVFSLLKRHTGTGTDLGKVQIRGFAASGLTSATLFLDQVFVSYAVVAQSVGYANGMIWIDTVDGDAGTEAYVNGVADNPVLTLADALTLGTSLNIDNLHVSSQSTFAPAADFNNFNVYGIGYTCNLGGHDYAGTHIFHASPLTGIATTQVNSDHFDVIDSIVGAITVDDAHFTRCSFNGTITLDQVNGGDLKIVDCRSVIAGATTPIIDCGTAAVTHNISLSNWQNGLEIKNLNNGGTNLFSISGIGKLVVASTCSGTMNVRGPFQIVDNSGGNVTFVYDDVHEDGHQILLDTGTDGVVVAGTVSADIVSISGSTTAADNLEQSTLALVATDVNDASATTTSFVITSSEATDDHFNGRVIIFTNGNLANQGCTITDYTGATKTVTVTTLTEAPADNDTFVIV